VYKVWQLIVALAVVFNCNVTFIMITFNSLSDFPLWTITYACDTLMMMNIFVEFFVVYVDKRGIAYSDSRIIAKNYLRGLFAVDLLSVFPHDYFLFAAIKELQYEKLRLAEIRINRFFGLIRVIKFLSESSF